MKFAIAIFAMSIAAHSQVHHGTVIVSKMTKDGFFIAADSRAMSTFTNAIEDNHCKIAALNQNAVFADVGASSYVPIAFDPVPAWNTVSEARIAAAVSGITTGKTFPSTQDAVTSIADAWAKRMELNWSLMKTWHPDVVTEIPEMIGGKLSVGIFAFGGNGLVSMTVRSIAVKDGSIISQIGEVGKACPIDQVCIFGQPDIPAEFVQGRTDRARKVELPTAPMQLVMRLVDLAITYDLTKTVGGTVDALQLTPQGQIKWERQKKDCPENHF